MAVDTDIIIRLANELKEARNRVAHLEAELTNAVAGGTVSLASLGAVGLTDLSVAEKVTQLLNASPGKTFAFDDIFGAIGGNEAYMRSLIARLIKEGRIESRGWGRYGAVSEGAPGTLKEKLRAVKP